MTLGALNLRSGYCLLMARNHQRGVDFQDFLRLIHRHYRGWHVAMLLDSDSSHTATASLVLAEHCQIEFVWLPKRSPHLNPMDHLWRDAKMHICANRQYESIEDEVEQFMATFVICHLGNRCTKPECFQRGFGSNAFCQNDFGNLLSRAPIRLLLGLGKPTSVLSSLLTGNQPAYANGPPLPAVQHHSADADARCPELPPNTTLPLSRHFY